MLSLKPEFALSGVLSWLFLGLGLALYVHDRIVEAPHIHPGLHGMDVGVGCLLVAWVLGWVIITCCTEFWYEVGLALSRFRARHLRFHFR